MLDATRIATSLADRYRVERELGAGGMATVYLAEDLRHGRKVALKVLRPELAAIIGSQRFLSEIRTTANLQHPNILPLFDSGEVDGTVFYVMPFVEGESLRDRLTREQQLPIDDAVRITREVAGALDYAHRHGVIHRDIKPENILLHDGRAVVADFGIALAAGNAGTRMTETGMSLGTPHYMSPEQAMGERSITARSDVFSLGCVLYELLTGEPPFTGPTAQAIIARVMTEAPRSIVAQRHTVPPHVDAAVRRALEKLPADRFQSAAELAEALTSPGLVASGGYATPTPASRSAGAMLGRIAPWVLAAAFAISHLVGRYTAPVPVIGSAPFRFGVELSKGLTPARVPSVVLSRDGTRLVYPAWSGGQLLLFTQHIGELTATAIPGTEGAERSFLSPDGRWVAFSRQGKLLKMPIAGGTPIQLGTSQWAGGDWWTDGRIVFTRSYQEGLWEVSETGGDEVMLTKPDTSRGELGHWWPQVLPGGDRILFTAYRGGGGVQSTIEILDRRTKRRTVLVRDALCARYLPSGHLLYAKDETLFAVRLDLDAERVTGNAIPIQEDVAMADGEGYAAYAVAANGTFAHMPTASYRSDLELSFVDRRGVSRSAIPNRARYDNPRLSPDGTRIAVDVSPKGGNADVWVFPVGSSRGTRITDATSKDWMPQWTPDGRELVFMHEGIFYDPWIRVADGSQPARQLMGGGHDRMPSGISTDGRLVALVANIDGLPELWTMSLRGKVTEQRYLTGVGSASKPSFSPDGRWLAYESGETGRIEVYVQSFPDPALGRWKLSSDGASEPMWTRGGREVVFRQRDTVMAVAVDPARKEIGTPVALFGGPYVFHTAWDEGRSYDVSRDGETFVLLREPPGHRRQIVVTLNWLADLETKLTR
ncbi:MAG TPA: protein kinase [Gemmatimonadaceae bacterium]|nr:protein kinase [Gemmatimonadaceae bacterium]